MEATKLWEDFYLTINNVKQSYETLLKHHLKHPVYSFSSFTYPTSLVRVIITTSLDFIRFKKL